MQLPEIAWPTVYSTIGYYMLCNLFIFFTQTTALLSGAGGSSASQPITE